MSKPTGPDATFPVNKTFADLACNNSVSYSSDSHSGAELKENEKTDTRQNLDKTVLEIEKMQIIFKNNFKKTIKQKS